MHKLMATSTIFEHHLSELRLLIERQTGVVLDCSNSAFAGRVAEYVEEEGLGSSSALLDRLKSADQDLANLPGLLDGLISVNTGFFRHPGALNALARQVVPQLSARKSSDSPGPLRIWSAGCATGEETYSIAISVCDALARSAAMAKNSANNANGSGNGTGKNGSRTGGIADDGPTISGANYSGPLSVHVVGSDLLPANIEAADRGIYRQSALDGLPPAIIKNYFSKAALPAIAAQASENGDEESACEEEDANEMKSPRALAAVPANAVHLTVKPRLRSLVTFNCMNLARPGYIGRFDCIFCMDVLPYFSRAQKIALIERLHLYLEPGGYLFLSQTEKLISSNLNFRSETFDGYTFHRKPLAASAAYGR